MSDSTNMTARVTSYKQIYCWQLLYLSESSRQMLIPSRRSRWEDTWW